MPPYKCVRIPFSDGDICVVSGQGDRGVSLEGGEREGRVQAVLPQPLQRQNDDRFP